MPRLSAASPGPQQIPKTTKEYKIVQLISSPWHKESPKDGALMLTATVLALCEDGSILRRDFNPATRKWVWRVEDLEIIE